MKIFLIGLWKGFKIRMAAILRPAFGYKYKIVYTELEVNASFKKKFITKLRMDESNSRLLVNLPKVNSCDYLAPFVLMYSKSDINLHKRIELKSKDHPMIAAKAYFQ